MLAAGVQSHSVLLLLLLLLRLQTHPSALLAG
jgi:hypothetical protein